MSFYDGDEQFCWFVGVRVCLGMCLLFLFGPCSFSWVRVLFECLSAFSFLVVLVTIEDMSLRLMEFAAYKINCCLAAFVSVGFLEFKLFASVGRAALARRGSFGPTQLTALLTLLSEMFLVHLDLFLAAGHFLATHTKELRPVDVTRVQRAFAKCNVRRPKSRFVRGSGASVNQYLGCQTHWCSHLFVALC